MPIQGISYDIAVGEEGQTISIVKEAQKDRFWVIDSLQYSYRDSQGAIKIQGRLTISTGGEMIIDADVLDCNYVNLHLTSGVNQDLTVTLYAGGPTVSSKLNLQTHIEAAF